MKDLNSLDQNKSLQSINLFVDDLREPPKGFVVARTVEEAIHLLETCNVKVLSLDHDMGEVDGRLNKTGYDLVKYFCEHGLSCQSIYLHTDNPVGRENMYETLLAASRRGFISQHIGIHYHNY